jgi:hypothetical protein
LVSLLFKSPLIENLQRELLLWGNSESKLLVKVGVEAFLDDFSCFDLVAIDSYYDERVGELEDAAFVQGIAGDY